MKIMVPSAGPGDWKALLADPEKHWKKEFSARALAHCWEDGGGLPPEVAAVLQQSQELHDIEPILACPEWKTPLPGGRRPSQSDVWVLARTGRGLVSITVEGKAQEGFGKTVDQWLGKLPTPEKQTRLAACTKTLGLNAGLPGNIRYQLVHRTVAAVIEARRVHACAAAMVVHTFGDSDQGYDDYQAFAELLGADARQDRVGRARAQGGLPLYLAWVRGDGEYLNK